ncbi:MAG TPA: hypothetical protein DEA08_01880 [Planctomycetes bacterium]|nr:hypothetical protein [Planctomycetota bacterium]|tara:strand:- start:772 stop:1128 length:357 start_codon:yes stop_codon:yes gene_type:complete
MPLVAVTTSAPAPDAEPTQTLLSHLSAALAEGTGKPESYVMTSLQAGVSMSFGGSFEPACLAQVHSVGTLTPEQTSALSERLNAILCAGLGVDPARVYVGFNDVERHMWAMAGKTFQR